MLQPRLHMCITSGNTRLLGLRLPLSRDSARHIRKAAANNLARDKQQETTGVCGVVKPQQRAYEAEGIHFPYLEQYLSVLVKPMLRGLDLMLLSFGGGAAVSKNFDN